MAQVKQQYLSEFDSFAYAKHYVKDAQYENMWFVEEFYHRLFAEGKLDGKTLIDVGCGPTLRAPLIASRYGCEVFCADFLKTNRDFLRNWLDNGHDAFDYSAQFKHVAQLEGKTDFGYLEERVKKSVKDVLFCDILADNPLDPLPLKQFDMVTSSLCLDCYPDEEDYLKGAKGLSSLVRQGGFLALASSMGGSFCKLGKKIIPCSNSYGAAMTKKALAEAGLQVLEVREHYFENPCPVDSDCKGFFTIYATKL